VTDEMNPTPEEEIDAEVEEVVAEVEEVVAEAEEAESKEAEAEVAAPVKQAPQVRRPVGLVEVTNDDDDDDYDDDDDDDDDDDFSEPRRVDGPAAYVERERRGRGRRVGSDIRVDEIDYKNIALLTRFLDRRGRILSRRKTRVSAKVQRRVVREIKRARHLALLPYTADQTRIVRKRR